MLICSVCLTLGPETVTTGPAPALPAALIRVAFSHHHLTSPLHTSRQLHWRANCDRTMFKGHFLPLICGNAFQRVEWDWKLLLEDIWKPSLCYHVGDRTWCWKHFTFLLPFIIQNSIFGLNVLVLHLHVWWHVLQVATGYRREMWIMICWQWKGLY